VKLFASKLGSQNRVSAFLGALRSFTQFALLSRRIHRGCAGIEYLRAAYVIVWSVPWLAHGQVLFIRPFCSARRLRTSIAQPYPS